MTLFRFIGISAIVLGLVACTDYNYDRPDTLPNRKGFEKHFGFSPSSSVTEIYCYADELGIDATYQLGFKADRSTIDKIVANLDLKKMDEGFDDRIATEFSWWKKSDLKDLKPYWKHSADGRRSQYLWYDDKKMQAWYLDFDL